MGADAIIKVKSGRYFCLYCAIELDPKKYGHNCNKKEEEK
jgi:hypothetical protein